MLLLAIVHMMLTVVSAVVADGFIAFFGLRDIRLNWGAMVYNSIQFLRYNPRIPWASIIAPTLVLSLFAAGFYFLGQCLQNMTNPRLRQRDR